VINIPSETEKSLQTLFALRQHGMKLGLDNITTLLKELGNPQQNFRFIHIAGTNGKGSVAAIIEAALHASGIRTGLYTSPHLIWFGERFRFNGASATPQEITDLYKQIAPSLIRTEQITGQHPTFFEVATAMALLHFLQKGAEWIVWETGMGGRLDATNVVTPEISVITTIGYDHCKWLGNTLAQIASEKAGIIKPKIPVVTTQQNPEAAEVIRRYAQEKKSPLHIAPPASYSRSSEGTITIHLPDASYSTNFFALYQLTNAALAIHTLKTLETTSLLPKLTEQHIAQALLSICWPARMDVLRRDPWLIIDGAHNPDGAAALAESLREIDWPSAQATLITASLADKDADAVAKQLAPLAYKIICTKVRSTRSMTSHELAQIYRRHAATLVEECLAENLPRLFQTANSGTSPTLIAGSLYLAGEALAALRGTAFPDDPGAPRSLHL
jgi:dihydrofolate synthase/folylpolyglutamate synthase